MRIVIVGGGAAGFSAAVVAKKVGASEVILIERTDMLGGLALVAGIGLCGSDAFAILREERALRGAYLIDEVFLPIAIHKELKMPGFERAMLYNVTKLDARMQKVIARYKIKLMLHQRVIGIKLIGRTIRSVITDKGDEISGDVFVDATGSITGIEGCKNFGYGCVGCILRCPTFGNPRGLVDHQIETLSAFNALGHKGLLGTSVLLPIASLSKQLQDEVNANGFAYLHIPPEVRPDFKRAKKAGSYLWTIMSQNVVSEGILLVNVGGYVKVTGNASARYASVLRKIHGLEESIIVQPSAGGVGHLVYGLNMVPRRNTMEIEGFDNLLCAGTKSGHAPFLMDVVCSGELAGYNAVRKALGFECLELPRNLAVGAFINYIKELMQTHDGLGKSTQSDTDTLKTLGVYNETEEEIEKTVADAGLARIYSQPIGTSVI